MAGQPRLKQSSTHRTTTALLLVCLLAAAQPGHCARQRSADRKRQARKPLIRHESTLGSLQAALCRWWITDDRGVVCSRDHLTYQTGCCSEGQQYSCETCNLEHACCMNYERCVSCCLAPQHNATALFPSAFRATDRQETGQWPSAFEYCRGKCRTTSRSTIHENAYLDPYHHCFSVSGKPITPAPPLVPLPGSVTAVQGAQGVSCSAACEAWTTRSPCMAEHFTSLNDCNRLRETFPCEAGCDAGPGAERPGYVVPGAPKTSRPAICLVSSAPLGSAEGPTCEGSSSGVQRLCPCGPQQPLPVPSNVTEEAAGQQQAAAATTASSAT